MNARALLSRLAWPAVGVACIGVAGFGLYVSLHALSAAKTWEGRYYAVAAENDQLKEKLTQATGKKVEMVVSVSGGEFAPRTLAQQNRNLCNIKTLANGERWEGQIGVDRHGHAIFRHSAYSVRACALVLKAYERRHGIKTVKALVERFAEGNREPYIKHLCKVLGVGPEEKISLTAHLPELLRGIVKFETGLAIGEEHLSLVAALR